MLGVRLLLALSVSLAAVAVAVYTGDSKSSPPRSQSVPSAPPVAEPKPIVDILHGTKVLDKYRWLENSSSPETQKWVEQEMFYTRALLDPLPRRDAVHKRLTELLSIGSLTPPVIAGRHYFYTRREGMQNQPVLYVRDRVTPEDHAGEPPDATPGKTAPSSTPTNSPPTAPSPLTGSSPVTTGSMSLTEHRKAVRR